jgi:hypothetical protein
VAVGGRGWDHSGNSCVWSGGRITSKFWYTLMFHM